MALFKLKTAKDDFLIEALKAGNLVINQRFPQPCSLRMPLATLKKIMADGFLFYDKKPEPIKPKQKTEFTPRDLIAHSHYGEFPDAVVTLKLAKAFAVRDGRNPDQAMRDCAGIMSNRISNQKLRHTLLEMVVTKYPDNSLVAIEKTIKLMAQHLTKELGPVIHAPNEQELAQALFQPRKLPLPVK